MKIIIAAVLSLISFVNVYSQWEVIQEGFRGTITTIDFVNENTGWLAGSNGLMAKTTDSGETWINVSLDLTWSISKIDFINEQLGWAAGSRFDSLASYTIIIKTSDGGSTWNIQNEIFGEWLDLIHAVDENYIYAAGGSKIYQTSNGGSDWKNISPNLPDRYFNSLWFRDSENGIITGNYYDDTGAKSIILKTTNGGLSWDVKEITEFQSIFDVRFFNDGQGYFRAYKDTLNYFCKTDDMLSTWTIMSSNSFTLLSFDIIDTNQVYGLKIGDTNKVIKSIDGGKSWQDVQSLVSGNKIYINNKTTGYVVGNLGWGLGAGVSVLYRSTDLKNWTFQKSSLPLNDICFTDNNRGFLATGVNDFHSFFGIILSTVNSGRTLDIRYTSRGALNSCVCVDDNTVFMISPVAVYKTKDSGLNWEDYLFNADLLGFSFNANDILFTDQQNGWIGGWYSDSVENGAAILRTTDQGDTWKLAYKIKPENDSWYMLNSLSIPGTTGWAAGEQGLLLKYSDFAGWKKVDSGTPLSLKKVFFLNEYYGWIVGGNFDGSQINFIQMKTTDGGITWQKKQDLNYIINDLWFVNTWHGWAVGFDDKYKGVILETRDGGNNWAVVVDDLMSPLKSIYIKGNLGWASGENSLLLHTTNSGPVWVEDENNIPDRYSLEQNYPNPFNPSTKIKFSIPAVSDVTLVVYDMLGRELSVLVNEQKSPGLYEVQFDGTNLSSGIYIYKLKAGEFSSVKKMILLK